MSVLITSVCPYHDNFLLFVLVFFVGWLIGLGMMYEPKKIKSLPTSEGKQETKGGFSRSENTDIGHGGDEKIGGQ